MGNNFFLFEIEHKLGVVVSYVDLSSWPFADL